MPASAGRSRLVVDWIRFWMKPGKMEHQLRALGILAENLVQFLTPTYWFATFCNSISRESNALIWHTYSIDVHAGKYPYYTIIDNK